MRSDVLWYHNTSILYKNKRWLEFWPTNTQTYEEKINAISRFVIISGIVISINNQNTVGIVGALLLLLLMYVVIDKSNLSRKMDIIHYGNPYRGREYVKMKGCKKPTQYNPFRNHIFGDTVSKEEENASACDYDDVKEDIKHKFNNDIYKSVWDVFDKENSQRQFYSMPNTKIVNEQTEYAEWLYGKKNKKTCKSNFEVCIGNEVGGGGSGF